MSGHRLMAHCIPCIKLYCNAAKFAPKYRIFHFVSKNDTQSIPQCQFQKMCYILLTFVQELLPYKVSLTSGIYSLQNHVRHFIFRLHMRTCSLSQRLAQLRRVSWFTIWVITWTYFYGANCFDKFNILTTFMTFDSD